MSMTAERDRWIAAGHTRPLDDVEGRLDCFHKAAQADPNSVEAWRFIANALCETGRWEAALQAVDRAQGLVKNGDPFAEYGCWLDRARALNGLRRFDEGLACCEAASTVSPDGCAAYEVKGLALHDLQRFDEAIECFDRYIERGRYSVIKAWGWNYRAASLRRSGRNREALEACERAIEYSSTESSFWVTKGNCLRDLRRFDDALHAQSHALTLSPSNWVARYNRALLFEDLSRWEQAVEAYEQYLRVVPAGEPGVAAARRRLEAARKVNRDEWDDGTRPPEHGCEHQKPPVHFF